jgi:hypothetical protein
LWLKVLNMAAIEALIMAAKNRGPVAARASWHKFPGPTRQRQTQGTLSNPKLVLISFYRTP